MGPSAEHGAHQELERQCVASVQRGVVHRELGQQKIDLAAAAVLVVAIIAAAAAAPVPAGLGATAAAAAAAAAAGGGGGGGGVEAPGVVRRGVPDHGVEAERRRERPVRVARRVDDQVHLELRFP